MGTITRSFANNITTSGVLLPASLNNNSISNVTAYNASVATGGMVLVSSATASSSASIEFSLGNYKEYQFYFVNIHPQTDGADFNFNCSIDSGSTYAVTKTTTLFRTGHDEADTFTQFGYNSNEDLAQSTADQHIMYGTGNLSDECVSGKLCLYNPSSTTYVKHFTSVANHTSSSNSTNQMFVAGYFNDTNDLTNIIFRMSSGNIDDGTILMYGIK